MSAVETVAIQRLIEQKQAAALLENFASSVPGLALAILRADGKMFASSANWSTSPAQDEREYHLEAGTQTVGKLVARGKSASGSNPVERAVQQSLRALLDQSLNRREVANEALDRYREINLMYRVSETIGALLDVERIPQSVLDESQRVIRADAGIVLLSPPSGDADWSIKASFGLDSQARTLLETTRTALGSTWPSERPAIITDLPESLSAILWAPLKGKTAVLGAIVLSRASGHGVFTASDEKLLMALASQAAISVENARLHQAVLEKERLEHELQLARDVQASLIPSTTPRISGWDFAAYWQPAREVSGDFYDFIPMPDGRDSLGVVIADVSDKGMHAALFMALTRSIVRASTTSGQTPADGLTVTNRLLCADSTNGMFVTLFYAQLDPHKSELTYVNAGHNPPLLYRARNRDLAELGATGIMLGFDEAWQHQQNSLRMDSGDILIFYTDGVTEAMNERNEQFGEDRLRELLVARSSDAPIEILRALQAALASFVGKRAPSDDVTIVIAKRL